MSGQQGLTGVAVVCVMVALSVAANTDGCSGKQSQPVFRYPAKHVVTLEDHTGLDGCGYLLKDNSSRLMLVSNFDVRLTGSEEGSAFRCDYEELEDAASICMKEDAIIRLECLQALKSEKERDAGECPPIIDPYRLEWAANIMQAMNPHMVVEITSGNLRLYRFENQDGKITLDCKGNFICFCIPQAVDACNLVLDTMEERVIYVLDNVNKQ